MEQKTGISQASGCEWASLHRPVRLNVLSSPVIGLSRILGAPGLPTGTAVLAFRGFSVVRDRRTAACIGSAEEPVIGTVSLKLFVTPHTIASIVHRSRCATRWECIGYPWLSVELVPSELK